MLYDSKQKVVPVRKELEYLHNYIELEKVRYSERLDVSINQYDEVGHFQISPFLLLPLVENSFKHGVCNDTEDSWIRIDLSLKDDWLTVKIENSKGNSNGKASEKNGIGLENVKRRLEILYPGKHEFKVLNEEHSYLTILRVKNWPNEHTMFDN
jgi:LytS/YehU family sensor histidine kinase